MLSHATLYFNYQFLFSLHSPGLHTQSFDKFKYKLKRNINFNVIIGFPAYGKYTFVKIF